MCWYRVSLVNWQAVEHLRAGESDAGTATLATARRADC